MSDKFQNKYRIPSARLQNWDYSSNGAYFITICTNNREHYFGEIRQEKMVLSNCGVIADLMWYEIKNHAKNIELGEFIVMPNHIHGILIMNNIGSKNDNDNHDHNDDNNHDRDHDHVETRHALSLPPTPPIGKQRFQNQGKNTISSIVGSYKSAVTKHCNRLGIEFGWQTRFHDHIIRDSNSFENIQNYIANNPLNWNNDKFYDNEK